MTMKSAIRLTPLLLSLALCEPAFAQKTDTVVLVNGNSITGEVKSLDFGQLEYSTDSMGTVQIDWEDVVTVTSNQALQVELTDGRRFFGSLMAPDDRFKISLQTASRAITFDSEDVVRITPIETDEKIWQRLEGSVSFGFNTNKGSEVTTLNLDTDIRYRTLNYLVGVTVRASVTDQPSEETNESERIFTNFQRFRPDRWFTDWFTSWEHNDATGIDSRYSLGYGVGRYFVQTNFNQFSWLAGVQGTRENQIGVDETEDKGEGRLQFRYLHRNLEPDTTFTLTSEIYPQLDDIEQFRSYSNLSFRREFIDDLFLDLTIYHEYQSESPEGAELLDYGITTSLGYSF